MVITLDGIAGSYSDYYISLTKSYNIGEISTLGNYVGGICGGDANGTGLQIDYTYNMGKVNGNQYIGGIVGGTNKYSSLWRSYNKGKISGKNYIGGISGYHLIQVTERNCYNIGEISGENNIGGIVGGCASVYNINIDYCYNNGKVTATNSYLGGIVGRVGSTDPTNCYYEENTALFGCGNSTVTTGYDRGTTKLSNDEMPTVLSVINSDNAFIEDLRRHKQRLPNSRLASRNSRIILLYEIYI